MAIACWWSRYKLARILSQGPRWGKMAVRSSGARPWDLILSSGASHVGNPILTQLRESEICHPLHRSSLFAIVNKLGLWRGLLCGCAAS